MVHYGCDLTNEEASARGVVYDGSYSMRAPRTPKFTGRSVKFDLRKKIFLINFGLVAVAECACACAWKLEFGRSRRGGTE